nr:MAG TPA: hypothetical protein [Caudoviricetes sp.]
MRGFVKFFILEDGAGFTPIVLVFRHYNDISLLAAWGY